MSEGTARRPRTVIDTNLFVSSIILRKGYPYALRRAWYARAFVLIISHFQRVEIREVLKRPKIASRYAISEDELAALLRRLDTEAELVDPVVSLPIPVRDPKDELILGTALAGQVDYLVTGDKDLLVLADDLRLTMLRIVTVADFLALLAERERDMVGSAGNEPSDVG